jgi:cytochrome P450/NADPH-cytochrome P450 reductase
MQEALMAMALIVQRFELSLDDPIYILQLKSTLTMKPAGLKIRASLREGEHFVTPFMHLRWT